MIVQPQPTTTVCDSITPLAAHTPLPEFMQRPLSLGVQRNNIDLVQTVDEKIGPTLDRLRHHLEPWLGRGAFKTSQRMNTLTFKYQSSSVPPVSMKLKVEINTREHLALDGYRMEPFSVDSRWYQGDCEIQTFSLEELLATKVRALYQRSKGRDAYDLDRALQLPQQPSVERIMEMFHQYMDDAELSVRADQFEANLREKLDDEGFRLDVLPLLAVEAPKYDAVSGGRRILQALLPHWSK